MLTLSSLVQQLNSQGWLPFFISYNRYDLCVVVDTMKFHTVLLQTKILAGKSTRGEPALLTAAVRLSWFDQTG